MTKFEAIATSKNFRKEADELLQRMKDHKLELLKRMGEGPNIKPHGELFEDINETVAQHILSMRDLESCIMRQGMALKYIGAPNPYPESKNPESPVVEPPADGLKM